MDQYIDNAFCFALGALFMLFVIKQIHKNVEDKITKGTLNAFKEILDNISEVTFMKRVNMYVYLKCPNQELIYMMDKKTLYIYHGDECVASSVRVNDTKVIKDLISIIETTWRNDINNIIIIDNNQYSMNIITKHFNVDVGSFTDPVLNQIEEMEKGFKSDPMDLDSILDKITKVGLENLSPTEKEFLEKYSK